MTSPSDEVGDDGDKADGDDDYLLTPEAFRFLIQPEPWMDRAACKGTGPEAAAQDRASPFFPERGQSTAAAYKMCETCPVREECKSYRVRTGSVGIWGGEYTEHPLRPNGQPAIQDGRPRRVNRDLSEEHPTN